MIAFGGTNPFAQLKDMLSEGGPVIASVSANHADGTATVTMRGGEAKRVRSPTVYSVGATVLVDSKGVSGMAPSTVHSIISVG